MKTAFLWLATACLLLAGAAHAQSGEQLLNSKGCLGCHGLDEKKMGPALRESAAKYKGSEAKLISQLREGKGHPMKVDASEAELKAMLDFLSPPKASAAKPASASGEQLLDAKGCLGCHGIADKKVGPALKDSVAKYKGAEGKLIAALKEGKGHPMKVEASEAELKAMIGFLAQGGPGAPAAAAPSKPAAAAPAAPAAAAPATPALDAAACAGCHGNPEFGVPGPDGKMRSLGLQMDRHQKSVHGPLGCTTCHADVTEVPHKNVKKPECATCHADQQKAYLASVHAQERAKGNTKAATCASCHTAHYVVAPKTDEAKLSVIANCGNCHKENFTSFRDTYHGKVTALGFTYTAKCYDCHSNHDVKRVSDPASTVHPNNRLQTCQKCHQNATPGFVTFQPHANASDFARYPHVWIAAKFMIALLVGVFLFFWSHTALWFYREWKDRKEGKTRPHVAGVHAVPGEKQYQRFGPHWRLAHLLFAISVMTLVLTGMAVFFGETVWAKAVVTLFGSPKVTAIVHRTAAAVMLGIFFIHLVALAVRTDWRRFDWFGPTSLVPNLQDGKDILAMFAWFFGQQPRPQFDRWTYWEKFDYWAVFWGMAIIGGSGMMLAFPEATASVLPGWVFNVATIVHGEEAVLAAVFLFTVHFFNNHFRPDKFPLDRVMFTGAVPLEEFKREHALEYKRLKASGELEKYLVDAPSRPMTIGSTILGFTLIAFGLTLLVMVISGFLSRI